MSQPDQLKIALLYGTDAGDTQNVGVEISKALGEHGLEAERIHIRDASKEQVESFDVIIMGIPTWSVGGIQRDWHQSEENILSWKLTGKVVAFYGQDDQQDYADYFLDAMVWLDERVLKTGATIIGGLAAWRIDGYNFDPSLADSEDRTMF